MAISNITGSSYDSSNKNVDLTYKRADGRKQKTSIDVSKGMVRAEKIPMPIGGDGKIVIMKNSSDGSVNKGAQNFYQVSTNNSNLKADHSNGAGRYEQIIQKYNDSFGEWLNDPSNEEFKNIFDSATAKEQAEILRNFYLTQDPKTVGVSEEDGKFMKDSVREGMLTTSVDENDNPTVSTNSSDGSKYGIAYDGNKLAKVTDMEAPTTAKESEQTSTLLDQHGVCEAKVTLPNGEKHTETQRPADKEDQAKADNIAKTINNTISQTDFTKENTKLANSRRAPEGEDKQSEFFNDKGKIYGTNGSLVYPYDLLTSNHYNNCYTMIFISEHEESSIVGVQGLAGNRNQYTNNKGSQAMEYLSKVDDPTRKTLVPMMSMFVAYKGVGMIADKIASSAMGKGLENGILGKVGNAQVGAEVVKKLATGTKIGAMVGAGAFAWASNSGAFESAKTALKMSDYKQLSIAIALPTPSISENNTVVWNADNTMISGGVAALMGNGLNVDKVTDWGKSILTGSKRENTKETDITGTLAGATQALTVGTVSEMAPAVARMLGKANNTRKEMLFKDVDFRDIAMSFNLVARSKKDMENIEAIVKALKYHMYPELVSHEFIWIYPAEFDIVHYYKGKINKHMPRHTSCVLTNVTLKYGNDSFINVHEDGSPTNITMTLQFKEIAQLNKKSVIEGY